MQKPENELKAELLHIISFRPDTIKNIRAHLTPREMANVRTNSVIKKFTFRNVVRYKIYKLKLFVYEKVFKKEA